MDHLGRECTVQTAAINAAMAGCLPEYFPVVLAAWDAVMRDRAAKGGGWQSTSGPAPLIVVNGPIRHELGFNCTGGIFAAGFRPNATIPRALGLMLRNAFGVVPHVFDQTTQGIPGPMGDLLRRERGGEPVGAAGDRDGARAEHERRVVHADAHVRVRRQPPHPEPRASAERTSPTRSRGPGVMIFRAQSAGIVFCPEHAQMLADAGYSKVDVKDWLVEHCGRVEADLRRAGKDAVSEGGFGGRSAGGEERVAGDVFTPFLPSRASVPIIVAGARNAAISMVFRVFGEWSNSSVAIEPAAVAAATSSEGRP